MSNYDRHPTVAIAATSESCRQGWPELCAALLAALQPGRSGNPRTVVAVELYPGIDADRVAAELQQGLRPSLILRSEDAFLDPADLRRLFQDTLGDDPVFSRMQPWTIDSYFDPARLGRQRETLASAKGLVLLVGTGAAHVVPEPALLLSANLGRWEIQQRQRAHRIANLGLRNAAASPAELYKIAFFLDWRVADRLRHALYPRVDFFLDLNDEHRPGMLAGNILREAVRATVRQPFRVAPFFDPGPWGGQWMRRTFDLPNGRPNYAWCFDCVPEENSVVLRFGSRCFDLPAIVLVHEEPEALLGPLVTGRFGAEFPIRFDLLDTVEGGNLSLQVHPRDPYIREHFGMPYTQDESYYILHAEPGASLYLGLREPAARERMSDALEEANRGGRAFPAEDFVARWPTATHDHASIPAGTVHCSGAGNVVLEISATPYLFTFKLWDWGRHGLDGRPRPVHLEHGLANIQWDRTASWVRRELLAPPTPVAEGDGWREERTGLHPSQFLETRRHWFTAAVPHRTANNLHVLNLVAGGEALVSSPGGAFAPLCVHFAETWIVPAAVGAYTVTPAAPALHATLKAYVRS